MRRVLRWIAWIGVGLLGLIVLAVIVAFGISELRLRQTHDVQVAPVVIPTDPDSIAFGHHIGSTWAGCTACHGDDLEGQIIFEGAEGTIAAPNLTSGEGGVGSFYDDEDWVRAIRHDVKPSGRANLFMLGTLHRLSDDELGAVIAWARSVPPVDNAVPTTNLSLMGRLFVVLAPDFILPARAIDHDALPLAVPPPGATAAYGEHIARTICVECHTDSFVGGEEIEGTDGVIRLSRNLTPAGDVGHWSESDFFAALRTGVTPSGYVLDSEAMPWDYFSPLTDEELRALWLFLQTLPAAQPEGG